ncbi:O-antigen ligase family protein [Xylanimonas ulmi]|uniref:O-antigen ligase n=1 Tax=Xylanimonas ulmi TaxID=228973 RepID=A0A4Q7M1X9_9MICO|nr:O-antigen ligase family protein [Xylanibacterium ulmi]RZS61855.1 O-antigen ligase [Xylanibacterium ulmi]
MTSATPTLVGAVQPQRRRGFDAVSMLTIYMVVLYGIPSGTAIAALGSLGRVCHFVGIACLLWWFAELIRRQASPFRQVQPIRIALAVFAVAAVVSYIGGAARGLPIAERSPSETSLIRLASLIGPALLAIDGIHTRERLIVLIKRVVIAGAAMATLGIAQFVTGRQLLGGLTLPGFTSLALGVSERGGFARAAGTAMQALEYSTVLAAALPLAVNASIFLYRPGTLRRWYPALVLALASLLSVSRSALICSAVGVLILLPTWPRRVRARAVWVGVVMLGAVYVAVPGMIGTIRGLFTTSDGSADSRTGAWDAAFDIAKNHLVFGRGFGSFQPLYQIFDDEYLTLLVEVGIVGTVAFLGMIVTAMVVARRCAARAGDDVVLATQSQAMLASMAAMGLIMAFFDGLAFPIAAGTLFLVIGCVGAAWNLTGQSGQRPAPALGDAGA